MWGVAKTTVEKLDNGKKSMRTVYLTDIISDGRHTRYEYSLDICDSFEFSAIETCRETVDAMQFEHDEHEKNEKKKTLVEYDVPKVYFLCVPLNEPMLDTVF